VLLPSADIADDYLPAGIQSADGIAHVITAYRTLPAVPDPKGLAELREGVDVVTFTSGSTVHNFITIAHQAGLDPHALPGDPRIACIGPKTAQTAEVLGFKVDIFPDEYTVEGLVIAINHAIQDLK
jgi:uroporphyrinogen-III synthase